MKRNQGTSRLEQDDHCEGGGGGDECANKKAKAAGPDICDDVLHGIFSRLTARDAARCAALSKRHRQIVGGLDFWLLQRRLGPPLPRPHIAYMATVGASESGPTSSATRPAPLSSAVLPGCMFLDFHLAGGLAGPGDDLRYSLIDRGRRYRRYVGTCNGIVLMAPESFDLGASILVFNPAVAGSELAVSLELPAGPPGHYRVSGFGYGPSSRLHKLLLTREERDLSVPGDLASRRGRAKELLVYTLGGGGLPSANQRRLRSVLPELDAEIDGDSVYLDGKIYLLAGQSRVLAFDVDDESVTAIDAPAGERGPLKPWRLTDVSGRLCAATGDGYYLTLWLLTADQQWVRLCGFRCGGATTDFAGAWDCGGVLLLYFLGRSSKVAYMHMYDTRKDEELLDEEWLDNVEGLWRPSGLFLPRAVAEQGGWESDLVLCCGYRPTLVSPGSIVGAPPRQRGGGGVLAALRPLLERDMNAGRERTLKAVCFMNLLLYIMTRLPDNAEDVIKEVAPGSSLLPFSLR